MAFFYIKIAANATIEFWCTIIQDSWNTLYREIIRNAQVICASGLLKCLRHGKDKS